MTFKSAIAQPSTVKPPTDAQCAMYHQWEKEIEWLNKNKKRKLEFRIDNCIINIKEFANESARTFD